MLGISLTALAIGLGTASALFDYYVDPDTGSDINPGTYSEPYATLSNAVTVALAAGGNKSIGIKRGTTLRYDVIPALTQPNIRIGAYGTGALPAFYGSLQTAVSSFTKVGNLYTITSHTFDPFTLALVSGAGAVTKLNMTANSGTVSAADPAAEGEWTWFPASHATYPNQLKFYSAATLTGYQVEVPQGGTAINGITHSSDNCTIEQVSVRFWSGSGAVVGADNMLWSGIDSSYNGGDGIDADQNSTGFLCTGSSANYNGRRYGAGGGPGDGFSAHSASPNGASGTIIGCTFIGNTQTGVGNQIGSNVTTRYCYFEDNYYDINIYNVADALIGSQTFDYNVIVHKTRTTPFFNSSGNLTAGLNNASTVKLRNNTIYYASGVTATQVCNVQGYTNTFDSNVFKCASAITNFGQLVTASGGALETQMVFTNNQINGTTNVWRTLSTSFNQPQTNTGTLTTDPLFTNGAAYNFTLQAGSPCIDAGTDWGQTRDYAGNSITGTPDRGAYER